MINVHEEEKLSPTDFLFQVESKYRKYTHTYPSHSSIAFKVSANNINDGTHFIFICDVYEREEYHISFRPNITLRSNTSASYMGKAPSKTELDFLRKFTRKWKFDKIERDSAYLNIELTKKDLATVTRIFDNFIKDVGAFDRSMAKGGRRI